MPTVEVTLVTIDPEIWRSSGNQKEPVATVTVQLAHTPLPTEQTVSVNVGTYSSDPAGIVVTYDAPSQIVHLPAGSQGVVTVKTRIKKVQIANNRKATIVVAASVTNPSGGIQVIHADAGLPTHHARFTVDGRDR